MTQGTSPAYFEDHIAEQAALRRVATLVARDVPAGEVFARVCQELGGVLGVRSTDMIRYDDDGQATVVGAWAASGEPSFPVGDRIPIDPGTVTGKLYATGRTQRIDDYTGVPGELAARLRHAGILSVVGAPINFGGRLWGGIMATSGEVGEFPGDTGKRMADFAELVTAALANADAREKLAASRARIVAAGDAARRRIERDLHDGAQQRLVSVALKLQLLLESQDQGSATARELETVSAELDRALAELRDLARGIHPSILTERGLVAALDSLAKRAIMPVLLDADPAADELPAPLQTTAYFLVAEALTNCAKHADCSRADVRVDVDDETLLVEVGDDGSGGAELDGGSGLRGLAERVSALDGVLEIESEPAAGTVVRARIPLCSCDRLEAEPVVAAAGSA